MKEKTNELNIEKLTKHHELLLTEIFNGPVFIVNYPAKDKPFYMKRTDDNFLVIIFY